MKFQLSISSNTIRSGFATLQVLLGNCSAYFISNSYHRIRSTILIQQFSGFILSPIGCLKSKKECYILSIALYMFLAPFIWNHSKKCKKNDFVLPKFLHIFFHKMGIKSVKSGPFSLISRHYLWFCIVTL